MAVGGHRNGTGRYPGGGHRVAGRAAGHGLGRVGA